MTPSVEFVLPNYNGQALLERFLPSVLRAARYDGVDAAVRVVDDASTDESVAYLGEAFPEVEVLCLQANVGFARAVNAGFAAASAEIVVLLNTDVEPEETFVPPLLEALEDPRVFGAVPRIRRPLQGGVAESAIAGEFRRGLFRLRFLGDEPFLSHSEPFPTLYPVGGAAALRREIYTELRGLDPLYAPYYWEDADLGYRAWKAGYTVLCVPESVVDHYSGTIAMTQKAQQVQLAQTANSFLFTWKNLHDPWWCLSHWLFLGPHCAVSLATGRWAFVRGLLWALRRLPAALKSRREAKSKALLRDREVLRVAAPHACERSLPRHRTMRR